jgi:hypothetical protein
MHIRRFIMLTILTCLVAACNPGPATNANPVGADNPMGPKQQTAEPTIEPTSTPTPLPPREQVEQNAHLVITALRDKDMVALARLVHPELGLRFSPYANVQSTHLMFVASQVSVLMDDPRDFQWGHYDGSGEPIKLSFAEYYEKFIYDRDFAAAERVMMNEIIQQGNTIINIETFYPGAMFVEYNFPTGPDPNSISAEMEWKSLRLVFLPLGAYWYLVGIVHDQWTI